MITSPTRLRTTQAPSLLAALVLAFLATPGSALAQDGPRGGGRPGGPGGPGGPSEDTKLVKQFDQDGDRRLNAAERKAAREFLQAEIAAGRGPRRPGPRGGGNERSTPSVESGSKLTPAQVRTFPGVPLYDAATVRTFFLEFESPDWEAELNAFYHTDVEVPARLTVDGTTLPDVGVHFRGASSFFTVQEGRKRSLNLSLDFARSDQRLGGYRTLNLLNSHTDPTFLRTVLYYEIANDYLACPRANYVRLVINGESWGIYINSQQVNSDFVRERFQAPAAARWKVPGSPRGQGGLGYLGDQPSAYQRIYEIKSKDDPKSWTALIQLCRTLTETPLDQLESRMAPLLDLDGALRFLALENTLINCDGYWIRASDYHLILDATGRFHLVPHDANETFRLPEGPGMRRGANEAGGVSLHPLAGSDDPSKPLLHRLLAVPSLKARYFGHVRAITEKWLDWNRLGPIAQRHQALIADDIRTDTRRLYAADAFTQGLTEDTQETGFRGPSRSISLRNFVEQRRTYLLGLPEIKDATLPPARPSN